MSELVEAEIEVDIERLDSDAIDEHLRSSTSVLQQILQSDPESTEGPTGDAEVHVCVHCGKLYKTATTLHMHVLLKHPDNKVEVRCTACDKQYASLLSLEKHVRYMHRYPCRCKACYRTFETPELLAEHNTVCSKAARPCPSCGKFYDSSLSLRNHVKYKHPERKTNWCEICRRTFYSPHNLANHFATMHPDGTSCSKCDKQFNSIASLQSHFLYKHAENGKRCHVCKKVFASRRSLTRHLTKNHDVVVSVGEKYTCGICDANFQGSQKLIDHVMEKHTGKDTKQSS